MVAISVVPKNCMGAKIQPEVSFIEPDERPGAWDFVALVAMVGAGIFTVLATWKLLTDIFTARILIQLHVPSVAYYASEPPSLMIVPAIGLAAMTCGFLVGFLLLSLRKR